MGWAPNRRKIQNPFQKFIMKKLIEFGIYALFLLNTFTCSMYLILSYKDIIKISSVDFKILFIFGIITTFAFGEIILKKWYKNDKENRA
jgi:hypothetical protein